MFQENGVRAGPTAPKASQKGGDEEKGESCSRDGKEENPKILGVERQPEEVKLALGEIQENCRSVVDGKPRKRDINREEKEGKDATSESELPGNVRRCSSIAACKRVIALSSCALL